jgi:uncharacterized protein YjbI with pentapeptide repeats
MITHITTSDLRILNACPESAPLAYWLLGRAGSWSGEWTVDMALELARRDGEGPCVGALGWLEKQGLVPCVLQGADLRYKSLRLADLRDTDLRGADLMDALLQWADLMDADLRGAILMYASLSYADFQGADLRGADLRGARIQSANLQGADLRGADIRRADLRGTYLIGANLQDAQR